MIPPKPIARDGPFRLRDYLRRFRDDLLSAQPARLYRAKMAELRLPFFQSVLINDLALVSRVLRERPDDFPKARRLHAGLRPLLGRSVFTTRGAEWRRQRAAIDPAFEKGRLRAALPAMLDASAGLAARLPEGEVEIEAAASHAAADRDLPRALLAAHRRRDRRAGRSPRSTPISGPPRCSVPRRCFRASPGPRAAPCAARRATSARPCAPSSIAGPTTSRRERRRTTLATRLLRAVDPETGRPLTRREAADQVAMFFLAGHETSASALSWGLYLLASHPNWQDAVAAEGARDWTGFGLGDLSSLPVTRDVFARDAAPLSAGSDAAARGGRAGQVPRPSHPARRAGRDQPMAPAPP